MFDQRACSQLPGDIAAQVEQVRAALQSLDSGRDVAAENCVKTIPLRSPMSDWRLLIRGLTDWCAGDLEAAAKVFSRLDPDRRPARIAETLLYADRIKAESATNAKPTPAQKNPATAADAHPAGLGQAVLSGAKLVHRTRTLRPALAEAQREALKIETISDLERLDLPAEFPHPLKMKWIDEFYENNARHEPELARPLTGNLRRHLTQTPRAPLLESLASSVPGPPLGTPRVCRKPATAKPMSTLWRRFRSARSHPSSYSLSARSSHGCESTRTRRPGPPATKCAC